MSNRDQVRNLLAQHGITFAAEATIRLRDKPAPLYQLLVLTTLSAARISAEIAAVSAGLSDLGTDPRTENRRLAAQ